MSESENIEPAENAEASQKPEGKWNQRRKQILPIVIAVMIALVVGALGMYGAMIPARRALESQLAGQRKANVELANQNNDLSQKNIDLSAKINDLTPTENSGTKGLTIVSSNMTTQYDSKVIEYTVRNDTNKVADEVSLDFRFLDSSGNSVDSQSRTNNAKVDPGKTGVVTVYLDDEKQNFPSAVRVQVESGTITVNGQDYDIDISDNGTNF